MSKLLVINSSPVTDNSKTRQLVSRFVERFSATQPQVELLNRDLGRNPPPHIDEVTIGAYYTPDEQRNPAQQQAVALSDQLVDELMAAETLVIGSPMHNFSITSALKTWIDHVARVGRTFQYGANGPEGLATGKKVYVISARGGNYGVGSPAAAMNHQDTYLKTVLGFIGITDVVFINAEGVASGEQGFEQAASQIDTVLA
ncbi:MAG: FMN-dependent NADH-azoreductase [Halopseudomonas sp.]